MSQSQEPQLIIPVPPDKAFSYSRTKSSQQKQDTLSTPRDQGEPMMIIEKIVGAGIEYRWDNSSNPPGYIEIGPAEYAPKTGWFVYYKGIEFPRPGFVYPQALKACEPPKRHLMNWLRGILDKSMIFILFGFLLSPRKLKAKILNTFLERYCDFADGFLIDHYFEPQYYHRTVTELRGFIIVFLAEFGLSMNVANRFAYALTTVIEYDSAYRVRIIDLLSETTKEKVLKNPIGEAKRIVEILAKRDKRKHLVDKFGMIFTILRYGFFFIKKPLMVALNTLEFSNLQYSEIDLHLVKHWVGYEFFGKTIEERLEMYPRELSRTFKLQPK